MKVRSYALLLLLLVPLLLGGCWDYRELDDIAWVMALGIDKGRENVITVTAQVAVPKAIAGGGGGGRGGGGGGGGGQTVSTVSMEAPTLLSALELMNAFFDRRADLSHAKIIVFSRELAEEGLDRYLAPLARFRQFRRTTDILIAQGRADKLIREINPILEDNPVKFYELLIGGWKYTEFIPYDTFYLFYNDAKSYGASPVAVLAGLQEKEKGPPDPTYKSKGSYIAGRIPRTGGVKLEIYGGAVFRGGRMVGEINGDELGIVKMLRGTFKQTILSVEDPRHPGRFIIVRVRPRQAAEIKVEAGDRPRVTATVRLEGDILSIQSGEDYDSPDGIPELERVVEASLQQAAARTITKAQELGADVFAFGEKAKGQFPTWQAWAAYDWHRRFPEAEISVIIDYKIRRVGLLHETAPIRR